MNIERAVPTLLLEFGESPVWDATTHTLLCVDIPTGAVHRIDTDGRIETVQVAPGASAVVLTTTAGLVAATPNGLVGIDADGAAQPVLVMNTEGDPLWRLNDAKSDSRGRLWSGSYLTSFTPASSSLLRLSGGPGPLKALSGLDLANGMDWSPDGTTMYLVDSRSRTILAMPFDPDEGRVGQPRSLVSFEDSSGFPDGLTVDADGRIWTAMYQGGTVRSFTSDGRPDAVLPLPTSKVTSLCFGGADLRDLYVTTARSGLGPSELDDQPHAGGIFVFPGLATGQEAQRFDQATIDIPHMKAGW